MRARTVLLISQHFRSTGPYMRARTVFLISQYFPPTRGSTPCRDPAVQVNSRFRAIRFGANLRSRTQNRESRMTAIDPASTIFQVRRADDSTQHTQLSTVTSETFSSCIPWRRFRSYRGALHYSGNYWCATTAGSVEYESRLELANLIELDFEPQTSWVLAQPFLMAGVDGGRMRRHIPDYLVKLAGGGYRVIDVKPAVMLNHPKVHESLTWSRRVVEAAGWEYSILSEPDPRRHANIRFLSGYRRTFQFPPQETNAVEMSIDRPMTIRAATSRAAEVLCESRHARSIVFHLMWTGLLSTDLSQPLQGSSIVAGAL